MIASLMTGMALPGWANAILQGERFLDSPPIATEPLNSNEEPKYTPEGYS